MLTLASLAPSPIPEERVRHEVVDVGLQVDVVVSDAAPRQFFDDTCQVSDGDFGDLRHRQPVTFRRWLANVVGGSPAGVRQQFEYGVEQRLVRPVLALRLGDAAGEPLVDLVVVVGSGSLAQQDAEHHDELAFLVAELGMRLRSVVGAAGV